MNYYALLYELVEDMVTRRVPFREEHLRLARESHDRGELVLGGALAEPVDRALLVFHVDDKSKVESFARKDPYVLNGLVKKWEVRPWNVVVGNDSPAANAVSAASVPASSPPASGAILRQWSAHTRETLWPTYLDHFSRNVLPELRRVKGYLGARLFVRRADGKVEILVETMWRSLESCRGFAGPDLESAVVAEEAAALLTDFDLRVRHFELTVADLM
jgi:uncharacterized protein